MPECCGVVIVFALPRDWTPGRGGRPPYMPVERATPERPGNLAVWVGADQRVRYRFLRTGEQCAKWHTPRCSPAPGCRGRGPAPTPRAGDRVPAVTA